ncbi:dihydrofolate reductase family protein [uncultured Thiohalocapsa sp.]|uniref:dihydrofolate reductase family protein n=1 Tax=uncultured Thiohalocapsa sp. TaxID=768990 RepID=UPI0025DEE0D8|nr:dihydrofolate reductase family protein [uncultured Thiohalocapsa sp.]
MATETNQSQSEHGAGGGLLMLYPQAKPVPLCGLYLCEDLRSQIAASGTFVYSNFITSLDGRIAVADPGTGRLGVPAQTANPRDWRLLLELAAPADAIMLSGRHVRELGAGSAQAWPPFSKDAPADLLAFRERQSLPQQPALVVVTRSLHLPVQALERLAQAHRLIVASVDDAPEAAREAAANAGAEVLRLGAWSVEGRRLSAALTERGLRLVYSTAGLEVLHLLLQSRLLKRLYMTTVTRILGGADYATLVQGARLRPPYDFSLSALYLDAQGPDGVDQLMQVYDRRDAGGS